MGVIDEVKERLDIVEVVSGHVSLKKTGRNLKGLCPFHAEKTPSFVVFPDTQTWHCFGACGMGGDVFSFVMRLENLDFSEALQLLAQRAGVELARPDEGQREREDLHRRLVEVNAAAATYFHNLLLHSGQGEIARQYLAKRGLKPETIERFQLGFALDSWDALGNYLRGKGFTDNELRSSGLVVVREDGSGHYDRFRNRLMIPIHDPQGRTIGFGGRVLDDSLPKYLNTSETPIFEKGQVLFGIDLAKATIRAEDTAIVVEGYMDVLQAHQAGISNVVAAMGTALTESQVKTLRRYGHTIVLALDPDAAGGQATLRGLDLSRRITLHEVVRIGPAVVESQYSSEADVRIAVLPPGQDPDDVIRENPALWHELIGGALPVIDYYFQLMQGQFDLSSAQGKSKAAEQLLPVLRDIENPIQRAHYVQKLATLLHINEGVLYEQLKGRKRRAVGQEDVWQTSQDVHRRRPFFELEEYCLMVLLKWPGSLARANDLLVQIGQPVFGPNDFTKVENQQLFEAVQRSAGGGEPSLSENFRRHLDASLLGYVERLETYWSTLPSVPEEVGEIDAVRSILKLRQVMVNQRLKELHDLCQDAESEADRSHFEHYRRLIQRYGQSKNVLERILYARTLAGQRDLARRYGVVAAESYPNLNSASP